MFILIKLFYFSMKKERERIPEGRRFYLDYLRHGEPVTYGATKSHLSDTGKEQMNNFAENYLLKVKGGPACHIRVAYSSWPRTTESAKIVSDYLRANQDNE